MHAGKAFLFFSTGNNEYTEIVIQQNEWIIEMNIKQMIGWFCEWKQTAGGCCSLCVM